MLARNVSEFQIDAYDASSNLILPNAYNPVSPPAFLKISLLVVGQSAASAMSSLGDQAAAQNEWEGGAGARFKRLRETSSQSFTFYVALQ